MIWYMDRRDVLEVVGLVLVAAGVGWRDPAAAAVVTGGIVVVLSAIGRIMDRFLE